MNRSKSKVTPTQQKAISDRISLFCKERKISYYVLSERSGVAITTLMNIIKGNTSNPSVFTINDLCKGLGITMEEFFHDINI